MLYQSSKSKMMWMRMWMLLMMIADVMILDWIGLIVLSSDT